MPKKAATVTINPDWCKGCRICVEICSKDVLDMSMEPAQSGYFIARVVNPEKCTACQECELHCPDMAITVESGKKVKVE